MIVRVIEDRTVGTMNALGPAPRVTMKSVLDECNRALGDRARAAHHHQRRAAGAKPPYP